MTFGQHLRSVRESRSIGLRELSRRMESSPTYLCRMETDRKIRPASEEWIRRWCAVVGEDVGETLALSGRVPADVLEYIADASWVSEFIKAAIDAGIGKGEWEDMTRKLMGER